jgi:hypothetical protein
LDKLRRRVQTQLQHDFRAVRLDRPHGNAELGGNFFVRFACSEQTDNLRFTLGRFALEPFRCRNFVGTVGYPGIVTSSIAMSGFSLLAWSTASRPFLASATTVQPR